MQQLGEVCAKMRRWPRRVSADHRSLARESLECCRDVFNAPGAVLVSDDGDEPWMNIAALNNSGFTWREEEDLSLESVVAEELTDRVFFVEEDGRVVAGGEHPMSIDAAIDPRIRTDISAGPLLSVPVIADSFQGRLFVCQPELDREVVLAAANPVASLLAIKFEVNVQLRAAVRDAVEQERIRVARDLHDGLLQSFTGVVLQLETVHSMIDNDPQNARRMITETQGLIMADQRDLRRFVEQLRPRAPRREAKFDFAARVDDFRSRFAKQWGIRVEFDVQDIDPVVSGFIGQETFRLIHEAVTNSARHGHASDVRVRVRTEGSEMHIEVSDNGTGFAFHGRRSLDEMRDSGGGPSMLAERVSSLNGTLTVDSTESGAVVTITVPLGFGA
ncbi:MAG TPA: sensor histidine kinase [Thermoanaerobaculia bacterium]